MKRTEQMTASDLAAERQARLALFLQRRMPDPMIAEECRLVLRSYCGNSDARVVAWLVRKMVGGWLRKLWIVARCHLHDALLKIGMHRAIDPLGEGVCVLCETGRDMECEEGK